MTVQGRQPGMTAPPRLRAVVGALVLAAGLGIIQASEDGAPQPGPAAVASALAEARGALAHGDMTTANEALARALAISPGDADARRLAADLGMPLPPDPVAGQRIRDGSAAADLAAACDDARFLQSAGRPDQAIARLEQALAAGTNASLEQRRAATALLDQIRQASVAAAENDASAARSASAKRARQEAIDDTKAGRDQRSERLARIADLRQHGFHELALANCRKLLTDLPGDEEVDALFHEILLAVHDQRRASITERERDLRHELAATVERSLIPQGFDGLPIFPSDWTERHTEATSLEAPQQMPAWKSAILDSLSQRVSLQFDGTQIGDALATIAKLGKVNLVVSPDLQASDKTVTLHTAAMQLNDVLSWATEQVGTQWSVDKGAVFVGARTGQETITSLHDISALLMGVPDFVGPSMSLSGSAGGGGGAGGAGGAGGGGLVQQAQAQARPAATPDDIAEMIKRAVSPRTWTTEGNSIAVRGNALWVTAPEDIQRLIGEFLRAQSEQHALAVHLDNRWLELSDTVIEEIGVEWGSQNVNLLNTGIPNQAGYVRTLNGWTFSGMTTNPLPASTVNAGQAAGGNGLTLQGAMIGASKLSAVLSAFEKNGQTRSLSAPEIACLNGQHAYTFIGSQIAYISDYQVVSNNYDVTVTTLSYGTVLDVQPLVSADRRYITLDLRSTLSSVTLSTEYITGYMTNGNGNITANLSFPLELPNLRVEHVGTTVMLPDRGSLLVGGFTGAVDQFASTRVPLLGSIPFLGRLFGARGRYSQNTHLYLLTTATILNYPELEARL